MNAENFHVNFEVMKEPRGFIKIIQFICSIVAFACVTDWTGKLQVTVPCKENGTGQDVIVKDVTQTWEFSYPFALDEISLSQVCKNEQPTPDGDFMANEVHQAQFFVCVGVITLLASITLTALYVCYDEVYLRTPRLVWADVIVHGSLAFFWFVSSATFASSIGDIKYFSSEKFILKQLGPECVPDKCKVVEPTYAGLHIAALVGFLNAFLWCSNLWFLYKETRERKGDFVDEPAEAQGPSGVGGYDPYGPGPQWGSGPSAVQGGLDEM